MKKPKCARCHSQNGLMRKAEWPKRTWLCPSCYTVWLANQSAYEDAKWMSEMGERWKTQR